MSNRPHENADISKESFGRQIASLGGIFWVANWIELVERFAFFGVRASLPIFMLEAIGNGGPELTQLQKGQIYAVWAVVQCFVPVLSGSFADRFGYKLCIAVYTLLASAGFLIMGYSIELSEWLCGMPLDIARPKGADWTYTMIFTGAMFVAVGTGIFKPGVQGLLANRIPRTASALGWGIFYQMVNVGGFLGPTISGWLHERMSWHHMFIACAAGALCNLIPLLLFREPKRDKKGKTGNPFILLYNAFRGLLEPRLFFFTITFAGFWLMFMQLFDMLTVYINDWVDSRSVASVLHDMFGVFGAEAQKFVPIQSQSGNIGPEWILNLDSLIICLFAFLVAFFMGRVRALSAIIIGMSVSVVAFFSLGLSSNGWWILGAIGVFACGEMMSGPSMSRYLAGIAPPGKEGQYMGYGNFTYGIGWATGSILAGYIYQACGDKAVLARKYLVNILHMDPQQAAAIGKDKLMEVFCEMAKVDQWGARRLLWDTYHPYMIWMILAGIGFASMLAIAFYTYVCRRADADPNHTLNVHGPVWVKAFLAPISLLFIGLTIGRYYLSQPHSLDIGLLLIALFFTTMLVISLVEERKTA
jgi:POT family proton-dependent oligopeptide transporter